MGYFLGWTGLRAMLLVLLVFVLSGCERSAVEAPEPPRVLDTSRLESVRVVSAPIALPIVTDDPDDKVINTPFSAQQMPPEPLDLALPEDFFTGQQASEFDEGNESLILPDMFEPGLFEQRTDVRAKLLLDDEEEDMLDSIDGMQITIEHKLD